MDLNPLKTANTLHEEELKAEYYVCPHHCEVGGYESCCSCGGWNDDEEHRLCTEAYLQK